MLTTLCSVALCASLSGCAVGGSTPTRSPVSISLIAPTDGAVVGVRTIDVTGTVTPTGATVDVLGAPVTVHHGTFTRTLRLSAATTAIPVTATASGFTPAEDHITVHFSPTLAVALRTAHRPVSPRPRGPAVPTSGSALAFLSLLGPGGGTSPDASSAAGPSRAPAATGPSAATGSAAPHNGSGPAPAPLRSSGYHPPGAPTPAGSPTGGPGSGPQPAPSAPSITAAMIRDAYMTACHRAAGPRGAAYCGCMYDHLARAGLLSSRRSIEAMARRIKAFERTGDIRRLPRALLHAQAVCAGRLPPPDLSVGRLPSLHHPAVPAPVIH